MGHNFRSALLLTAALLQPVPLNSQATSGAFLGWVSDPAEARVPDVKITATNLSTRLSFTTRTSSAGAFMISGLPPGRYRVEFSKTGFRTTARDNIEMHIDQQLHLDVSLELDVLAQNVLVPAMPAILPMQSTETGEIIESKQILDLPLLGRDFLDLTLLVPGVTSGAGGNNANYSINGQREFANSIVVNGVEVTGNRNNDTNVRPSVEAVAEFKTLTSSYAAEFGRAAGGVIAVLTKSGSNEFHGGIYEFLRRPATTARTFFATEPSRLKENDFGASLGGPLRRNRTFFFVSYEARRQRDVFSYLDTTVPAGMVSILPGGSVDLSGLRDPYTGKQIPIFDPEFYRANYYSSPFPGNVIPASRVSRAGLQVLQELFPRPNAPGIFNGWFNNFAVSQPYRFASDTGDLRLDQAFSERDRLSVTYDVVDFRSLAGDPFAGAIPIAGGGGADLADRTDSSNHSAAIAYTRVVSSTQTNDIRLAFVRTPLAQNSLLNGHVATELGIGGVNLSGFPSTQGLPQIYLGFGALTGGSTYKPLHFRDSNISLSDAYNWNRGNHSLKFGYEYRRLAANPSFSLFPTGYQYYYGAYASLTSDPTYSYFDRDAYYGNGGSEIADLLLGIPGYVALGLQLTTPKTASYEHHAFWQDTWRLKSRLSLNYGVRYEYQDPYHETRNHAANFDPQSGRMLIAGAGGNSAALVRPDRNNFSPRFGFAWQAFPNTVLRTGFGIYYSPENSARSDVLTKNYPFFYQQIFLNNPGAPVAYPLDTGVTRPVTVPISPGTSSISMSTIPNATSQSVYYIDPNIRTGYSQAFNFTIQHAITSGLMLETGYAGGLSHKLPYAVGDLNLGKRISKDLGKIYALFSEGNSAYHALQLKMKQRWQESISFLVSYTYAKNLDNGPAPFNLGRGGQWPQDFLNLGLERLSGHLKTGHMWSLQNRPTESLRTD
ncbi:MAG: hypothetical protein C5B51_05895, partial [Terriglobia bacterium]